MNAWRYAGGLVLVQLIWLGGMRGTAADPPADAGVEVQTRGPVHEAFAEPVTAQPRPSPIVPKKPPDAIDEVPPDQKPEGTHVLWIPGYWAWDDEAADFLWVSGFWRNFPPGRQWVPGYWQEAEGGYQWVPGYWADETQQEVQYLAAPPPSIDAGPSTPAPGDDSVYVPGCWVWRQTRFYWRPGFWNRCQEGYVWEPACYRWTPFGCIFVEGHWDYALRYRGVLFAPVVFANQSYAAPNVVYTPSYVIYNTALVNALFVRPDYGHYYFGDYFDPEYARHGFVPWFDYRIGRSATDPLFSYYHWHFRDHDWEQPLRTLYAQRRSGAAPRPPRTLAEQTTLMQKIQNTNASNVKNVLRTVNMTAPVSKVDQSVVKLQPVPKQQLGEERQASEQIRNLGRERQKVEQQFAGKGLVPGKQGEARTAKLELPKSTTPAKSSKEPAPGLKAPPPAPKLPQHEERAVPKHEPEKPLVLPKEPRQAPRQPERPETKGQPKQPEPAPKIEPKPAQPPAKAEPKQPEPAPKAEPKPPPKQPEPAPHPAPQPPPKQPELAPQPHPPPKAAPAPPHKEPEPKGKVKE